MMSSPTNGETLGDESPPGREPRVKTHGRPGVSQPLVGKVTMKYWRTMSFLPSPSGTLHHYMEMKKRMSVEGPRGKERLSADDFMVTSPSPAVTRERKE